MRGIVAIGQAVHHPGGALGAPVARIAAKARERNGALALQLFRRRLHEQPNLEMSGMVAERDGGAVGRANAALRAQDVELLASQIGGIPAHAGVLRPSENVTARTLPECLFRQWKQALRAWSTGARVR